MHRFIVHSLIVLVMASGCASVTHRPVKDFNQPKGIPYYLGSYYLLVHTDGKGNLESKILFLPDPNKKMVAKPKAILSSLSATLGYTNGVLSSTKTTTDTSAVLGAVIGAAKTFLTAAIANEPAALPAPTIYKIRIDSPTEITFIGEETADTVEVIPTSKEKS